MAFNILDAAKSFITPDLIGKAASYLQESESSVGKAVSGLLPASLLGITQKAETGGGNMIMDLAKQAMNSGILGNLGSAFSTGGGGIPDSSPGILNSIFGDKVGSIANAIASFAGIKGSSAASLLGSIAPMVMGFLGKHATENGLSASGLSSLLSNQKSSFLNALPAGLNIGNMLGISSSAPRPAVPHVEEPKKSGSWLMPLVLGLAAVALLLYLFKGCGGGEHKEEVVMETPAPVEPAPAAPITPPARESLKVKLVDGTEIDAYKGGIEDKLVACLNDATCVAGRDQWFDFDNLNFETGSARLTAESIAQIRNIVAILKAYPAAKIKIGGYTDKVGNDADNKKLSQERADAVLAEIRKEGANAAQLVGAEGYGEELAKVAETASDEERRVDRRISVQLREK
ncbi:OmpA family protein [Flavihumibacter sp. RY-1]|uniref:OmpA family protein n=1 Tax=Flavihumibacter fluminis TaxID=2909236 RepID=A0ABS9BM34_9BACT|nr:OmpA family protein [Flavihumibacter fluminis]MCF1716163.1 OmpA family protein [Flavihumibacter fluminis]